MFNNRFFPARIFAPRYFAKVGSTTFAGVTGGVIEVRGGTDGAIAHTITGVIGGRIEVRGGVTPGVGAILPDIPGRLCFVFINGVDRSDLVKCDAEDGKGIQRTMQIGGGSKATCTFILTQENTTFRPTQGDEVIIYVNRKRWFAGLVDNTSEFDYTGTAALSEITVNCADYGALLDRIIIGKEYQAFVGQLASILFNQITKDYLLPRLGIAYVFTFEPSIALGDQIYNWLTATDVLNGIASAANADWRVDFDKNLYLFPTNYSFYGSGYQLAPAPFDVPLVNDDGKWIDMTVTKDSSKYRNRMGARNSANVRPLWTDTFIGDSDKRIWATMSPLQSKPIVRVNGVAQVVVNIDQIGSRYYDYYWLEPTTVLQNLTHAVLTSSDTLTVTYPSVLSYVAWAQDDAEVALYGAVEGIVEVKDITSITGLQAIADAELARRKVRPITATIRTDQDGLEPGMRFLINTSRPLLNDTLVITQVTSVEIAKKFFRHTVRAVNRSNLPISNEAAFYQKVVAAMAQPKDRVRQNIVFHLAETVEGATNPGLTTGLKVSIIRAAPDNGFLAQCTLFFNSSQTVLTTTEIEIDVFMDGVSIFGTTKMIWPAGATTVQTQIEFLADPFPVVKGDLFTCEVLSADALAMDGILNVEMLVQ